MRFIEKTASLAVIDLEALINKDADEIQKLVEACQTSGIFYLKLQGSRVDTVFEDVPVLFKTAEGFFNLPSDCEEKTLSLREGVERGYHVFKGFEYYEIACEDHHNKTLALPASFDKKKDLLDRTINNLNSALETVVRELATALDITMPEVGDGPAEPSDTGLKLVHKDPLEVPGHIMQPWHTDSGLATLLWYDSVTAQIPVRDKHGKQTEDWETVPVVDGAVLVNVADELAARSGGRLHSPVHRAVSPPGDRRVWNGLVYLLRPYKA